MLDQVLFCKLQNTEVESHIVKVKYTRLRITISFQVLILIIIILVAFMNKRLFVHAVSIL